MVSNKKLPQPHQSISLGCLLKIQTANKVKLLGSVCANFPIAGVSGSRFLIQNRLSKDAFFVEIIYYYASLVKIR